jgi:ferredoxin
MLYANRDIHSVIFAGELDQLQQRHADRLEVRHHLDVDRGFLDANDIATFTGDALDADFYICGPAPFMDLVETSLLERGVETEHIFIERFVVPDPAVASGSGASTTEVVASTAADVDVPDSVTVILHRKSQTIAYRPGDTILETARRGGLHAPYSCEAGNCATCMAILREGTATMRANNALTDDEVEEGWVLTCQALPHGPTVTVEYEAL